MTVMSIKKQYVHRESVDTDTIQDLTTVTVLYVRWGTDENGDGVLLITFDGAPTDVEKKAIRDRIAARDSTEETHLANAAMAYQSNIVFLAMTPPRTSAQIETQVEALTRQAQGFIELSSPVDDT